MVFDAEDAVGVSVRLEGVETLLEERDDLKRALSQFQFRFHGSFYVRKRFDSSEELKYTQFLFNFGGIDASPDLQRVLVVQLDVAVFLAHGDHVDERVVAEAEVLGVSALVPYLKTYPKRVDSRTKCQNVFDFKQRSKSYSKKEFRTGMK